MKYLEQGSESLFQLRCYIHSHGNISCTFHRCAKDDEDGDDNDLSTMHVISGSRRAGPACLVYWVIFQCSALCKVLINIYVINEPLTGTISLPILGS